MRLLLLKGATVVRLTLFPYLRMYQKHPEGERHIYKYITTVETQQSGPVIDSHQAVFTGMCQAVALHKDPTSLFSYLPFGTRPSRVLCCYGL
jgi:hypothetical protein